jgi:rhamnose utilization protein RhaD (predicted bifunctional aldolase and dehydrogenase)/NAD(P)-dependent dehydrogenase (short-subunit alcohol dehydrogenase family)
MKSAWDKSLASHCRTALEECAYGSRVLGSHKDLVLHGGGNTSIKEAVTNIFGQEEEIIYIKGSGWDLSTIKPQGFNPLRLSRLRKILALQNLSDTDMVNELLCSTIKIGSPRPSIESLLHALLPHRSVLHSHADAILVLTNQKNSVAIIEKVYGDSVIIIPYVKPGFDLVKKCQTLLAAKNLSPKIKGLVLLNHGLFTFGETMEEAYLNHVELITTAENFLGFEGNSKSSPTEKTSKFQIEPLQIAKFRKNLSDAAGFPVLVSHFGSDQILRFVSQKNLEEVATRGPATPDHVIHTKRLPIIGMDVNKYVREYEAYFKRNQSRARSELRMLDPIPRYCLDKEFGLFTIAQTIRQVEIVHDIVVQTMDIIESAENCGQYAPLNEGDLFDIEYWELEQAKLQKNASEKPLVGQVALVTGAASGIGKACVEVLLDLGACVVGADISEGVKSLFDKPEYLGIRVDLTDEPSVSNLVSSITTRYGGLDILVASAGIFGQSQLITGIDAAQWDKTISVNLNSTLLIFSACHPLLAQSPAMARVVLIGSKNALAPGKGAGAYSVSKAAVTQLARVAALEWAEDGIRVNVVHPDAVFDTALWTDELLKERAKKYGVSVEEYKTRNLLKTTVSSHQVGLMVGAMCTSPFASTTGAQVSVDGGSDRTI